MEMAIATITMDGFGDENFEKAFAIDAEEIDANFELGKLARKRGDLHGLRCCALRTFLPCSMKVASSRMRRTRCGSHQKRGKRLSQADQGYSAFVKNLVAHRNGLKHP